MEYPPLPPDRWPDAPGRYPDPAVRVLDPRFDRCRLHNAAVERIATGCRWVEGPVWFGDHRCLVWSDIPNNRMLRWDEATGAVTLFRSPSNYANGHTRDRQGRLVSCEHLTRRVTGPNTTARSRCSSTGSMANRSTHPTTWWWPRTARCGSPTPATESCRTTRVARRRSSRPPRSTGSTPTGAGSSRSSTTSNAPMVFASPPTSLASMSWTQGPSRGASTSTMSPGSGLVPDDASWT